MTRGRLTYIAILAGLFLLHVMLVDYISYYVLIFFLLLPCASLIAAFALCRNSAVVMRVTPLRDDAVEGGTDTKAAALVRGCKVLLELRVSNPALIPVRTRIDLVISNEFVRDGKGETVIVPAGNSNSSFEQTVTFGRPGKVQFRVAGVGVYDPLGIFLLRAKSECAQTLSCVVFPEITPVAGVDRDSLVAKDVENDGRMRVVKGDDPSELYDIREYQPGDLISRIHWKLSHKSGRLMVKELGRVVCGDVLIMLDLNGGKSESAALLGALASVSDSLSRDGAAHDIEWYSARGERIVRSRVESESDGRDVLSSILCEGGLQDSPCVLRGGRGGGRSNPYSKVIYMCSQTGADGGDLPSLMKRVPASDVSVLIITEEDGSGGTSAGTPDAAEGAANAAPRILRAAPADAAAVLMESAL
jgi:uncharacterized protein (DUF58 family)